MTDDTAMSVLWLAVGVAVTVLGVVALGRVLHLATRARPALNELVRHARWPARLLGGAVALRIGARTLDAAPESRAAVADTAALLVIVFAAWLAIRTVDVGEDSLLGRFDVTVRDNLRARSIRTQVHILRQVVSVLIVVLAAGACLATFDWGRSLATSLLAAGGILGVVAGVSGRSTIGNLIAGLQVAFAEQIRLDDVVVVEGEYGNVEQITLTYVAVRLWDRRRLILPTSYFVERPFENWTRSSAELLGTVTVWVDHSTPLDELRAELERVVTASEYWDGGTATLQVTETTDRAIAARAVVSAADAPSAWNLRCEVREALVGWLARTRPECLPRVRLDGPAAAPRRPARTPAKAASSSRR